LWGSLEWTHKTTLGTILAHSLCRFSEKILHVTYNEAQKSQSPDSMMRR